VKIGGEGEGKVGAGEKDITGKTIKNAITF